MAWTWLILPLGVSRATQIVLHDRIFEKPRAYIENHGPAYLIYSIGCPWCTSTQLGLIAAALLAWDTTRAVTLWILLALATSFVAVVLDRLVDKFTPDPPPPAEPSTNGVAGDVPDAVRRALSKSN